MDLGRIRSRGWNLGREIRPSGHEPCRKVFENLQNLSPNSVENFRTLYEAKNVLIRENLHDYSFYFNIWHSIHKFIANKCNFDLIHGPSIFSFCIPILENNFEIDLSNNAQYLQYFNIFHENYINLL